MSFRGWFKKWLRAFLGLLTVNAKRRKTDAQRQKEKRRRIKAKFSGSNFYKSKKKRARRSSSNNAQNRRIIEALLGFTVASLGILFIPFKLFGKGRSGGVKGASNHHGAKTSSSTHSAKKNSNTQGSDLNKTHASNRIKNENKLDKPSVSRNIFSHTKKACEIDDMKSTNDTASEASQDAVLKTESEINDDNVKENSAVNLGDNATTKSFDENTPKSKPKHSSDKYIRKRMIIDNPVSCNENLEVGSYFDLLEEEDSARGENAVKLVYNGQKIGYLDTKDTLAIYTCLRLRRKIYGVITDITENNAQIQYEFEAWFDYEQ